MHAFTDIKGNRWAVAVTVATVKRVKALLNVDLLSIADATSDLYQRIATDPAFLCDLLFVIVKPDADAMQITDEAFAERLAGSTLDEAIEATLHAIADFFPKGRREALQVAAAKMARAADLSGREAKRLMEAVDVEQITSKAFAAASGSSPASSASTPTP